MGRIAQALKKAHQERAEKLRLGLGEASALRGAVRWTPDTPNAAPVTETASATTSQSPVSTLIEEGPEPSGPAPARTSRLPGLRSLASVITRHPRTVEPVTLEPLPPWDVHPSVVAIRDRESPITEQYRAVRTWLLRRSGTTEHSCIAITSSIPREGKSITVANLAAVMAEIRHLKVLAVDADFRQGRLATLLKTPNAPGLADVVAGRITLDEAIRQTPRNNLQILTAGAYHDLNPAELINSTAAATVFEEIRERYHFVVVDTPPVQKLSDTGVIGALCSGIVVVVRMNKAPAHLVKRSVHWLQSNNLNVIGCIAACCGSEEARTGYRESDRDG